MKINFKLILALSLASLITMWFSPKAVGAQSPNLIQYKAEDFSKEAGTMQDVYINSDNELVLNDAKTVGYFESNPVETSEFKVVVGSWTARTSKDTSLTLMIRVKSGDTWSKWFSYGKYTLGAANGIQKGQSDAIAVANADEIVLKGGKKANALQYKLILERKQNSLKSPSVSLASFALSLSDNNFYKPPAIEVEEVDIPVPTRSQMSVPKIGNILCSPTSLSMLLEYNGVNETIQQVAQGVRDNGFGVYGNWTYNVAYAGEKGFNSYVERGVTINDIKKHLAEGVPVALSIKTKKQSDLTGAPLNYNYGHILVVRGFTKIDGIPYFIVNDPAEKDVAKVKKYYREDEIANIWAKIIYVVKPPVVEETSGYGRPVK